MPPPRPILGHGRLAEVHNVPAVQPGGEAQFTEWYEATLRQECARADHVRESYWTEAAAVGERDWVQALASRFPTSWRTVEPAEPAPPHWAERG
jgi:hypothetical protein